MLVLTRKEGESIVITLDGQEVLVTVVQVDGNRGRRPKVRLGVTAPPEVRIARKDKLDQMKGCGHGPPSPAPA